MEFGLAIFSSVETATMGERAIDPVELGRGLEERGFESLFLAEHTHVPVNGTQYPGPEGDTPPNYFYSMLDPFVTLSMVAATTERLKVATGVALVPQHDPILLAKQVATLDLLSGGRFVFGVGAGWNLVEAANHGIDPKHRFDVLRERLEAIREIWDADIAEYHGAHVDFGPLYSWPKPVQRPHPPIFLGGWAPAALRRVVDLADGWLSPNIWSVHEVADGYRQICEMAEQQGKAQPRLTIILRSVDARELALASELKPDRALIFTEPFGRDQMLHQLDEWASAVERYR